MRTAIIAAVLLAFTGAADAEHWEHVQTHLSQLIDRIDIAPNLNTCSDVADVPAMYVTTHLEVNGMSISYGWEWACRAHQLYICPTQSCQDQFNEAFWTGDHWIRINPPPPREPQVLTQDENGSAEWGTIPRDDPGWAPLRDKPELICKKLVNYPSLRTSGGFDYRCQGGLFAWTQEQPANRLPTPIDALFSQPEAAKSPTAESPGYRPPFQPGNLYGAPMCTFIPDNPQAAPTPSICILRSDNGTYAVRAGKRDRCGPYNCGELIQQWKIRPDATTGSVSCAFMYNHTACHTAVEWREETDRLCAAASAATAKRQAMQRAGWGTNAMFLQHGGEFNAAGAVEAKSGQLCADAQGALATAEAAGIK